MPRKENKGYRYRKEQIKLIKVKSRLPTNDTKLLNISEQPTDHNSQNKISPVALGLKRKGTENANDDDKKVKKIKLQTQYTKILPNTTSTEKKLYSQLHKEIQNQINLTENKRLSTVQTINIQAETINKRKINNTLSKARKRLKRTPAQKEADKEVNTKLQQKIRSKRTPAQKEADRELNTKLQQKIRSKRTPAQKEADKEANTNFHQKIRSKRTPAQKEADKEMNTKLQQKIRSKRTPAQKEADKEVNSKLQQKIRSKRTPAQKEADRELNTKLQQKIRSKRTPSQKEADKEDNTKLQQKIRSKRTPAQKEADKEVNSKLQQKIRSKRTPAQKEAHRELNTKLQQKIRSKRTPSQKEADKEDNTKLQQKIRSKRTPAKKEAEKEVNSKLQQKIRSKRTPAQKEADRELNTKLQQKIRSKRTPSQKEADKEDNTKLQQKIRSKRTLAQKEADRELNTSLQSKIRSKRTDEKISLDRQKDRVYKNLKRQHQREEFSNILKEFQKVIQDGPTYTCTCCHRLLYKQSVQRVMSCNYLKCTKEILLQCLTGEDTICKTCHRSLQQGHIPAMASVNKLQVKPLPPELECLSELEARLIAKRIPFMKLLNLPCGKQKAVIGSVVNVPVDVTQTCASLPRSSTSDMGFIPLKLKRKMKYTGHVQYQMIRPSAVEKALCYLKQNHKLYRDIDINALWQQEFESDNEELWQALTATQDIMEERSEDKLENSADHNNNEEQNEININTDVRQEVCHTILQHEKNQTQTFEDQHQYHPTKEAIHDNWQESFTSSEHSTVLDSNEVDESNEESDESELRGLTYDSCLQPENIAASASGNKIFSIAPGEGRLPTQILQDQNNEVLTFPHLFPTGEFGFDVERNIKLTLRKYFMTRLCNKDNRFATNVEYLFYAQFLTDFKQVSDSINIALRKATNHSSSAVTAGQVKNDENRKQLIKTDKGYQFLQTIRGSPAYCKKILYDLLGMIKQLGPFTWFLTLSAADLRWPETICIIADQFKVKLTKEDVEALSWEERCSWIRKNPITAARQFDYRVQQFIRLIIKGNVLGNVTDFYYRVEFQQRGSPHIHMVLWSSDAPDFESAEEHVITNFIDSYISCNLPEEDEDEELYFLVNTLQRHVHSHTCRKTGKKCRFHYPRPPSDATVICRISSQGEIRQKIKPTEILHTVFDTITNEDVAGLTLKEVLTLANIPYNDYMYALRHFKSTNAVVHKREPKDVYINNYNPNILRAWQANTDLQYITDPYACVMYIASYMTKPEHELGELLTVASKQAANMDLRSQLKKVGSKFLSSREVSAQEAAYRILSLPLKRSTREVIYVPTDVSEERVRMLKPMNVIQHLDDEDEDIYMEGMVDRYIYRPKELENICLADFISSYRLHYKKPKDNEECDDVDIFDNDDQPTIVLKLQDNKGYITKRKKNAVIRTHRYSKEHNPEKYFHSQLILYVPYRKEKQLLDDDGSYNTTFRKKNKVVLSNKTKFEKHAEVIEMAYEQLEENGPPEDAWAQIAGEIEHQRHMQQEEGSTPAEEYAMFDPANHLESQHYEAFKSQLPITSERQESIMPDTEYLPLIRSLNVEQRFIFNKIYEWCFQKLTCVSTGKEPDQILTFITGGAGSGKSHLIKALYQMITKLLRSQVDNPEEIVCLLTAPTGTAARNIHGQTVHSAFSIMPGLDSCSHKTLSSLRVKFANLKCIIIDEVSMLGCEGLVTVHNRLTEIIGKPKSDSLFGGVLVIVFGDLYQLPPVGQSQVFALPKSPKMRLYGSLWQHFHIATLSKIMRQRDDIEFAELLNRIRTNTQNKDDIELLRTRQVSTDDPEYPANALHVYTTNKKVDQHNQNHLAATEYPVYTIKAQDMNTEHHTGQFQVEMPDNPNRTGGLRQNIQLSKNARVMITKNIDTSDGLVNGAQGTIVGFYPQPPENSSNYIPVFVLLEMDDPTIGSNARDTFKTVIPLHSKAVPIHQEEVRFTVGRYKVAQVSRRQFPLTLSWACTIHKVQGQTLDKIVISCEGRYQPGQFYVAVSRVTKLSGLFFLDFDEKCISCNNDVTTEIKRMTTEQPFKILPLWTPDQSTITIAHLNINSLAAHIKDLKADLTLLTSDIICITETWLTSRHSDSSMKINSFNILRVDRELCYNSDQIDSSKLSYGGVCSYTSVEWTLHPLHNQNQTKGIEYELFKVERNSHSVLILHVYRPPWLSLQSFTKHLIETMDKMDDLPTLVLGDFNINTLKQPNNLLLLALDAKNFQQVVCQPTHVSGSCIDHLYIQKDLLSVYNIRVLPVPYSQHAAFQINIKI